MPASKMQDIFAHLTRCMKRARGQRPPGIAVIVGAGCSMQYGLPSFYDLLKAVYDEHWLPSHDPIENLSLENLRTELEGLWEDCGETEIREILSPYLSGVKGEDCRGYRILACLAKQGLIHSIVNMNFDTLLEEAFEAEGLTDYGVSQSFRYRTHDIMVYKVHGSLRPDGGEPFLSIEKGHLFDEHAEGEAAANLLSKNHVLVLGYSGVDNKILEALRTPMEGFNLKDLKLFVVNVHGPGVQLSLIQRTRKSPDLSLIGEEACFANFAELAFRHLGQTAPSPVSRNQRSALRMDYMTTTERQAIEACRRLAMRIRSTINVADYSAFRIEEHADDLFQRVVELSRACGIPLTEAEKYLVRAAACFHDLGFFWARSGHNRASNPGFKLLHEHGQQTSDLLPPYFHAEDMRSQIVPSSYDPASRDLMLRLIQDLCRLHTTFQIDRGSLSEIQIFISTFPVSLRFDLVHALFVLAEETLSGHPWITTADLALSGVEEILPTIEDPVSDLYWGRQGTDLSFRVEARKIIASSKLTPRLSRSARWLLQRTEAATKNLNDVADRYQGRAIHLEAPSPAAKETEFEAVSAALTAALKRNLQALSSCKLGRLPSLLDLLAIYVLPVPGSKNDAVEPRVPLSSKVVTRALKEIEDSSPDLTSGGILGLYFMTKPKARSAMEQRFCRSFERILYPAWRFLAQHWSLGVYSNSFAHIVLTMGSSRFRTELALGIRSLVRDKILPDKLERGFFYGHSGCMQCTGLLLHIFSTIRQRLAPEEIEKLVPRLEEYMSGLLRFLLSDELEEKDWFGLFEERERGDHRVQSISYLAWAIQGLIQMVNVDEEIRREESEGWLKPRFDVDPETLRRFICRKWADLCNLSTSRVGSIVSEGGFSHGLHNVFLCWLEMRSFEPQSRIPGWLEWAYQRATSGDRGEDRRFTLIPALIGRSEAVNTLKSRRLLVRTVEECLANPLWIDQGENRGSWGYNASKTQELTLALVAFWLYAFEHRDTFEPLFTPRTSRETQAPRLVGGSPRKR